MRTWQAKAASEPIPIRPNLLLLQTVAAAIAVLTFVSIAAWAQSTDEVGGEATLKLPDLSQVLFLGIDGHRLLTIGILFRSPVWALD